MYFKHFLSSLLILSFANGCFAQLENRDVNFDFKSVTMSYDALYRRLEKPEKIYTNTNNSFQHNYPAEIDNLRSGYYYRGKVYCGLARTQPDADSFAVISDFSGLRATNFTADETALISIPGSYNTTNGYIRTYAVVYPVTMNFYKKGVPVKTIDFFTATSPLVYRFTKEQVEPGVNLVNSPFSSKEEIADYEKSGKLNKAAEKYAYFEAIRRVDELIKSLYGSFDYDFEIGTFDVKKKKASVYSDLNAAVDIMEAAIGAYKKKNTIVKDSLAGKALQQFIQLSSLNEERMNQVAKEMLQYNMLVSYALLGDIEKAQELLAKHRQSGLHTAFPFSTGSIARFVNIQLMRQKLAKESSIHL